MSMPRSATSCGVVSRSNVQCKSWGWCENPIRFCLSTDFCWRDRDSGKGDSEGNNRSSRDLARLLPTGESRGPSPASSGDRYQGNRSTAQDKAVDEEATERVALVFDVYYSDKKIGEAATPKEAIAVANQHQGQDLPIRGWQREGPNLRSEGGFYTVEAR